MLLATGIVLAGRRNEGRLRAAAPACEWEALVPLAGQAMGRYVVAALAGAVDRVIVAGPEGLAAGDALTVAPGGDLVATLRSALGALPADEQEVILAAGDAPLLTAVAVTELMAACRARSLAFGYPIVGRAACEDAYPGVRRTYVRLREGSFTGGNCLFVRRAAVPALLALAEQVYAARKRPLRLAGILGWGLALGLLTGTARLAAAERAGSRLLGQRAGAVRCADPGVGVDVDKPEDLELCRRVLAASGAAAGRVQPPQGA